MRQKSEHVVLDRFSIITINPVQQDGVHKQFWGANAKPSTKYYSCLKRTVVTWLRTPIEIKFSTHVFLLADRYLTLKDPGVRPLELFSHDRSYISWPMKLKLIVHDIYNFINVFRRHIDHFIIETLKMHENRRKELLMRSDCFSTLMYNASQVWKPKTAAF